jgi:hypothetical protein
MSKLDEYIKNGKFPVVRTGISNSDLEIKQFHRILHNTHYTCSLCDCDISPKDFLTTQIQKGFTVPREGFLGIRNESEVLGFICKTCYDSISDYDNLYYG